ncbi:MAG: TolC family protein [Ferruginibacter sp.]
MKNHALKQLVCLCVLLCHGIAMHAQDTLQISLPDAENKFLQNNLSLLAEKYNIDISRAAIIQARLYNNPTLNINGSLYDPVQKKAFNVSNRNGQYFASVEQLVRLAGKRNKEIKLAETASMISESNFYDLLRTLRFTLRSTFYEMYYTQRSVNAYQQQISSLEVLNRAYITLKDKNIVSQKDAVRIQALLYGLQTEQATLQNQVNELGSTLQLLLQDNSSWYIPVREDTGRTLPPLNLQSLIDSAYANRADFKTVQQSLLYRQQNYQLQKAMAVPDLTLGVEFDKRSNYIDNATLFSVTMDLPFFNRNQGNIKAARYSVEQSKVQLTQQQQLLENEVQKAYAKVLLTDKMLHTIDSGFQSDFEMLLKGVTENFQRKNISLIEFTDFYESYKNNFLQLNSLKANRMQAIEGMNYAVGKLILF